MNIRICTLLLAWSLSMGAYAELTTMVRAVEVTTANINVPTSVNGRLTFKPCAGNCKADFMSVRLTPETRFRVNGEMTDFVGFRQAFFNLARDKDHYALVSYDAKSNTATSVHIAD